MTHYRSSLFAGVAIVAIAGTAAHAQSPAPAQINFAIPAGPLGPALNAYASQAGRQLMFTSTQVAGRQTPGINGRMTADEALDRLLTGTGLTAVRSTAGSLVLQRTSADAVMEATTLDEVVVTGTLLRGPGETPSPVTVIRRDDLDRTGRGTVAEALAALPQNYAGSGTPTAALVGSDPMQSNPGLATGINLRGLGPDSTLVLVNGRRMAGAGGRGDFADVSAVPTAAVDRVDVLLDGASALYGADAVGGVVNIILRRDFDGQESPLRLGASHGGAESVIAAHTWGRTWSGGQALLSYEFERQNALSTTDRDYAATGDLRPFGGTDRRTYYGTPGNIVRFDAPSGAYVSTYAIRPGPGGVATTPADFVVGQQNYGNTRTGAALVPSYDRHAAYLYARQALGDRVELSGDLRFSQPNRAGHGVPTAGRRSETRGRRSVPDRSAPQQRGDLHLGPDASHHPISRQGPRGRSSLPGTSRASYRSGQRHPRHSTTGAVRGGPRRGLRRHRFDGQSQGRGALDARRGSAGASQLGRLLPGAGHDRTGREALHFGDLCRGSLQTRS